MTTPFVDGRLSRHQFELACQAYVAKYAAAHRAKEDDRPGPERIAEGWGWKKESRSKYIEGNGYLSRRLDYHLSRTSVPQPTPGPSDAEVAALESDLVEAVVDEEDLAAADAGPGVDASPSRPAPPMPAWITSEQSVVYSSTYRTPVFCFTAQDSSGSSLPLPALLSSPLFHAASSSFRPPRDGPDGNACGEATTLSEGRPRAVADDDAVGARLPLLSQGEHPETGVPCWSLHPCETAGALSEVMRAEANGGDGREGSVRVDGDRPPVTTTTTDDGTEAAVHYLETWFMLVSNVVALW